MLELFSLNRIDEIIVKSPLFFTPEFQDNGRKSEDLIGGNINNVFTNGVARFEWLHQRNDKEVFETDVILKLITIGKEEHIYVVTRDISDRKESDKKILDAKLKLEAIMDTITDLIIYKDLDLKYVEANKAYCTYHGLKREDILGKTDFDIFPKEAATKINDSDKMLLDTQISMEYDVNLTKENGEVETFTTQKHIVKDSNGKVTGMVARIMDITHRKKLELQMKEAKEFTQTLLDSQEQIIITTDGEEVTSVNQAFLDFFNVTSKEEFTKEYKAGCICETFDVNAPDGYLQMKMGDETWIEYVLSNHETTHKVMITKEKNNFIFSVTAAILPGDVGLKSAVFTNITEMENAKQEIEGINKHTRESIEYASLIQGALIPDAKIFENYFSDYLAIWQPKDIVGGDIYLFEELRDRDECLLMVIDCTGHGVPGAFVTMLVKAIERQIVAKINADESISVSPAWILSYFNRKMKQLLKQENKDSISNAGFDGGIIYYNKKDNILKFAGAETPLFYMEDKNLKTIKGSRHSIGYKKSDMDFEFKEHTIEVKEGMEFYLTTDGYLDQNGGEKSFPFGKKSFKKIIEEYHNETMADQQEVFLGKLDEYQGDEETNDDVTLVGFKI